MTDSPNRFRNVKDHANEAVDQLKTEVDQLVEGFDLQQMSDRLEDFGKKNPLALALAALTVGVAAGLLMRRKNPI